MKNVQNHMPKLLTLQHLACPKVPEFRPSLRRVVDSALQRLYSLDLWQRWHSKSFLQSNSWLYTYNM